MELKNYQKMVMKDLRMYMKALSDAPELFKAWSLSHGFSRKDIAVGRGGVPPYNNSIQSVPHVCMKVRRRVAGRRSWRARRCARSSRRCRF